MALFSVRNILTVAAGISASAMAVRKALGKEIDKRADRTIEKAVEEAREEIRIQAHTLISDNFKRFVKTTLSKALLVLIITVLFLSGLITSNWAALFLGIMFIGFTSYDFIRAAPALNFIRKEMKKHGWRPKLIFSEVVSAQVFEKVLERASGEPVDKTESVLMLLAGKKRDDVVERVARAVAEVASTTSWDDIKPLAYRFAARFSTLFVLYSALVWSVIWLIDHNG